MAKRYGDAGGERFDGGRRYSGGGNGAGQAAGGSRPAGGQGLSDSQLEMLMALVIQRINFLQARPCPLQAELDLRRRWREILRRLEGLK